MIVLIGEDPRIMHEVEVDYDLPVQFPHFEDCGLRVARVAPTKWMVVEPNTGRWIGHGSTMSNAYAKAAKVLRDKTREQFEAKIAAWVWAGEAEGPYCDVPKMLVGDTAIVIVPAGTERKVEDAIPEAGADCDGAVTLPGAGGDAGPDLRWSYEHDRPACFVQPGAACPVYG